MKFFAQAVQVHQLTAKEWGALQDAHEIIQEILDFYNRDSSLILQSPNTGECIQVDELPRVLGILSFLMENRVFEVQAKTIE
jgi:hypothetical protein